MGSLTQPEMQTFSGRLASFQQSHHLSKRRASSQGKKKQQTLEWPHESPAPEELARAGFFYKPSQDNPDNVQCFLCTAKLDGWEPADSPMNEHLAHSQTCAWAISQSVARQDGEVEETRDPYSNEMLEARRGTFEAGTGWVHEGKRGWRCKTTKMIEAGWCFDPSPDTDDGTTCFYCNLSLDGWEPKDDPMEEHRRRGPDCPFFDLVERYRSTMPKKGKGKGKSRESTASRMSMQSQISVVPSEAPSGVNTADEAAGIDGSVMTTGTVSSQAGGKSKKKGVGRSKAAAKVGKGKKKASSVAQEEEPSVQYPDLSQQDPHIDDIEDEIFVAPSPPQEEIKPKSGGRKPTRQSKQAQDSSVLETSQLEPAPKKRGRKPNAKPEPALPEPEVVEQQRDSMVQLQEELDHSMDLPDAESTPHAMTAAKPKRGVKRSSDGLRKQELDSSGASIEETKPAAKKRDRKPKAQAMQGDSEIEAPSQDIATAQNSSMLSTDVEAPKPAKGKKAPAAKHGKGRKASTRSFQGSRAEETNESALYTTKQQTEENLEADEREIEAELARIAAEEKAQQEEQQRLAAESLQIDEEEPEEVPAIQTEHDVSHAAEYEPPPSRPTSARSAADKIHALEALEDGLHEQAEAVPDPGRNLQTYVKTVTAPSPRSGRGSVVIHEDPPSDAEEDDAEEGRGGRVESTTPSPAKSDKENKPSSAIPPPTTAKKVSTSRYSHHREQQPSPSPVKTTRIPLAPSTPNLASPSKYTLLSPSKAMSHLSSSHPWHAVDVDAALLAASPERMLAEAGLSDAERSMNVEEWVRWRAAREEESLRRRCEGLVERFEREGLRGLESLRGIGIVG